MWLTLIFVATAAVFGGMAAVTLWHLRWVQRLPASETLPVSEMNLRCSVIVAARNEEARIEQTVRQLLAQRGVELELIVVDDRSTDRTPEILRQLANEDSRIQLKRVEVLPDGWLGKCHACHAGASAATGDWILFTDADCWLKPDVIARGLLAAQSQNAQHITLASGIAARSSGLAASHLAFLTGIADWFSAANRDTGKRHLGFGAFNLVRADAYRQCGGYEALRLTVLDDVKLGLLLQRAGQRTRAFMGGDDVEAYWGANAFSIIKIMEKNYFAAIDYRTSLVVFGGLGAILFSTILVLGLISGTAAGVAAALSPLSLIVPGAVLARRLGWSSLNALLIPFLFPVFYAALLNSTLVTLRQGGIRWRDTFYSIESLRAGGVR